MPRADDIPDGHTDFAHHSHSELIHMLFASDPKSVTAAADVWSAAGTALHERSVDLTQQLTAFQDKWTGGAADQYKLMIKDLASGIERVATTALEIRDLTYSAADALQVARDRMPAAVAVPALSSSTLVMATTPLPAVAPPGDTLAAMAARQAHAKAAVQQQQQAQASAAAAQDQAVQIMMDLANQYTSTKAAIPTTPNAAAPPTITTDTAGATVVVTSTGITYRTDPALSTVTIVTPPPSPTPPPASPPLFGQMFSAGLAAAAAALGGRFAKALPGIVQGSPDPNAPAAADVTKPAVGMGSAGGGGGGGGSAPVPAAASPLLTGSATALGTTVGLAGAMGAASATGGGFMPAMPFGGMMGGADGMSGARRIPPWLVETEDVWGESAAVTPSVIGGEGDPGSAPGSEFF